MTMDPLRWMRPIGVATPGTARVVLQQNGHHDEDDPMELSMRIRKRAQAQEVMDRQMDADRRRERIADMKLEAEEADLEERLMRRRDGNGKPDQMQVLMAELIQGRSVETAQMRADMAELQRKLGEQQQAQLNDRLGGMERRMEQLIERGMQAQPSPMTGIAQQLAEIKAINDGVSALAPAPAIPTGLDRQTMLESQRIAEESELRRLQFRHEMAKTDDEREARRQDLELQKAKMDGLLSSVSQIAPVLTSLLATKVGEKVGDVFTKPQTSAQPPEQQQQMLPWNCPACGRQNMAPPSATSAHCSHCHQVFSLQPNAGPPQNQPPRLVAPDGRPLT